MRNRNRAKVAKSFLLVGTFILFLMLFFWLFFFTYYVHEVGHMIFGFGDGALRGHLNRFSISAWAKHPLTPFIPLPQQTKIVDGIGSLNFAMGGPLFNLLVFLGLSLIAYKRDRNKAWFLIFLSILIFEVSGNIICGTDNFYGNPLAFCNRRIDLLFQFGAIFLFSATLAGFTLKKLIPIVFKNLKLG